MTRPYRRLLGPGLLLAVAALRCGESSSSEKVPDSLPPAGEAGSGGEGGNGSADDSGRAGSAGADDTPAGAGGAPDEVEIWPGSVGSWCGPAVERTLWLVTTPASLECSQRSEQIPGDAALDGLSVELPVVGIETLTQLNTMARYCSAGSCGTLPVTLTLESYDGGVGVRGSLAVTLEDGSELRRRFDATWCSWDNYLPPHPDVTRRVTGLRLAEIAVFQSVKIPLMRDRLEVTERNADVVAERMALVRAYVAPNPTWQPRTVRARLTLVNENARGEAQSPQILEQTRYVADASSEERLESTFNFEVPAESIGVGARYALELHEVEACVSQDGDTEDARFPDNPEELLDLGVRSVGGARVHLVPVQYGALVPDTSPAQIDRLRQMMVRLFPITGVELTVREPPLVTDVTTMTDLLDQITVLRDEENPAKDVSYYGLVRFTALLSQYCASSCVLGAAVIGEKGPGIEPRGGSAVGIGYGGDPAAETFAHEMGHVFGRAHTPCNVEGDQTYPYPLGGIGSWGYDSVEGALKSPETHKDFMGYCAPIWVSDYVYAGLSSFVAGMNQTSLVEPLVSRSRWRSLLLEPGSAPRWGAAREVWGQPPGVAESAAVLDRSGKPVVVVTTYRSSVADAGGERIYVPEPRRHDWWGIRLTGYGTHAYATTAGVQP